MVRLISASLLAGTLGGVITYGVLALFATGRIPFLRDFFEQAPIPPVIIERRAEITLRQEEALAEAIKKITPSLAEIIIRPLNPTLLSSYPSTILATALAVTDDGWLVTREMNLPSPNRLAVRDHEGNIIPVVDAKKDPWAGLTFLKLERAGDFRAAHFPQTPLELGTFLAAVVSTPDTLEVFPTYLTADRPNPEKDLQIESTETLTRLGHLRDELPVRFKNHFAIRLDGAIAGVVNGNTLLSGRVLAGRLALLLETDTFSSPALGFGYRDTEKVMVTTLSASRAANQAGLKVGDRILEVNNTPLARDTVFAEVLAGLSRKKSVTLRIERGTERGTDSIDILISARN